MSLTVDERDELRSTARGLLSREASSDRVRATVSEAPGFDRVLWDQMVELGWTSMHVPPEFGGSGAGYARARGRAPRARSRHRPVTLPGQCRPGHQRARRCPTTSNSRGELLTALVSGASLGSVALASTRRLMRAATFDGGMGARRGVGTAPGIGGLRARRRHRRLPRRRGHRSGRVPGGRGRRPRDARCADRACGDRRCNQETVHRGLRRGRGRGRSDAVRTGRARRGTVRRGCLPSA